MIVKFKLYENVKYIFDYIILQDGDITITKLSKIFKYINVQTFQPYFNGFSKFKSPYEIDIIIFLKEIFLYKYVTFTNWKSDYNVISKNIHGSVQDIKLYFYQDEVFVQFKLNNEWFIVNETYNIEITNYDAYNKALHQKMIMLKQMEKYNL